MQTDEHLDANATASELDRFLDGPVQPGDVDAMIEALKTAVPVAQPTPEAARSQVVCGPTENASKFVPSRRNEKPPAGACVSSGTLDFLLAAEHALHAASSSRFSSYGVPSHMFTTD